MITKKQSKMTQGMAVLMMLYFHLFTADFPNHISLLNLIYDGLEFRIACIGRICTALFAMVSGYGMTKSVINSSASTIIDDIRHQYQKVFIHLKGFYEIYWLVFAFFIPIRFWIVKDTFSIRVFVFNLIGLKYDYNPSWWYVHQYIVMMLLFPIVYQILFRFVFRNIKIAACCLGGLFVAFVVPVTRMLILRLYAVNSISYMVVFCVAMIIAYFNLFEMVDNIISTQIANRKILASIVFLVACCFRVVATGKDLIAHQYDFILAPIFTFCLLYIFDSERCEKVLLFFGKHSVYIWLVHAFFYLVCWKSIFEWMKYSVVMYFALLLISTATAMLLGYIKDNWIDRWKRG